MEWIAELLNYRLMNMYYTTIMMKQLKKRTPWRYVRTTLVDKDSPIQLGSLQGTCFTGLSKFSIDVMSHT